MFNKEKLALFGYGKTTKAIASFLGNGCIFFDDNKKELEIDKFGNKIYPSSKFNAKDFEIEVATPSLTPNNPLVKNSNNLYSEYDFFLSSNSLLKVEPKPFTIWISGTNGKTTTTQMLTHLLEKRGAVSGGNIGTPLAELSTQNPYLDTRDKLFYPTPHKICKPKYLPAIANYTRSPRLARRKRRVYSR